MRESLNEGLPEEEQLSLNDMLLKAAAVASEKVPDVSLHGLHVDVSDEARRQTRTCK